MTSPCFFDLDCWAAAPHAEIDLRSFLSSPRRALGPGIAIAVACVAGRADANGRFPQASQLIVDPSDPQHIVVRATYGVLQSTDGGASWRWICEKSVGYSPTEIVDPAIAIGGTGAVIVGMPSGVSRSTDRACTFSLATGVLSNQFVIDVSVDKSNPRHAVGVNAVLDTSMMDFNAIYAESTDEGQTWSNSTMMLPADFNPLTVDLAPSRPQRVYVSGRAQYPLFGQMVRSDDGGATWESVTFALNGAQGMYIGAIDPVNPDVLYVRFDAGPGSAGRVAVSTDRGTTYDDVLTLTDQPAGLALSPDGKYLAVGGPNDPLYVASTTDLKFSQVNTMVHARCLTWTQAGLYACGTEKTDGFSVGLSTDMGSSFAPLYKQRDLLPLDCAPGTTTENACPSAWPSVAASLAGPPDAGPPPDAGSDAGTSPPKLTPPPSSSGGSCGCAMVGDGSAWAGLSALAIAAAPLLFRRRRSRVDRS